MARVVALIASFHRAAEVARLLDSLARGQPDVAEVILVDNADSLAVSEVAKRALLPVRRIVPGRNLGCGGGVARALQAGCEDAATTHFWILDDDVETLPGALAELLSRMARAEAEVAVPLMVDGKGHLGWFPGPLPPRAWREIRRKGATPAEFRSVWGEEPCPWQWAPWPALLVTRRAVDAVGWPRDDYWFQGEDLEYTLRLSAQFRGILVPTTCCRHLPPAPHPRRETIKLGAMLQNNAYTFLHLPHGRRARCHLPGNAWRYLCAERWHPRAWLWAAEALWQGALRGRPAGAPGEHRWPRRLPGSLSSRQAEPRRTDQSKDQGNQGSRP